MAKTYNMVMTCTDFATGVVTTIRSASPSPVTNTEVTYLENHLSNDKVKAVVTNVFTTEDH